MENFVDERTIEIALEGFVENSELVQLAILESMHRYYYDKCFDKTGKFKDDDSSKHISAIYKSLWCKYPDWRQRIKDYMKRYMVNDAIVNHLHTFNKPKIDFNCTILIKISHK